jgi:prepilin-type N-terminal cleavage/methylation domain-containing protein
MYTRGFSIIELLIALLIIVTLSSIAAVSFVATRNRSNDDAIKANLATIQTEAEVYAYYQSNQNLAYGAGISTGNCNSQNVAQSYMFYYDTTIRSALIAISSVLSPGSTGILSVTGKLMCSSHASPPDYTVAALLSSGKAWCVDSTGFSGELDSMPVPGVTFCNE